MSGSDVDQLDADAILSALVRHDTDFVVIGGFAVAAHGYVRATKDVDVVPEPSAANLARLYEALREIGAEPMESGGLDPVELPVRFDAASLGGGGNGALRTRHGRIDVMQWVPGLEELRRAESRLPADRAPRRRHGSVRRLRRARGDEAGSGTAGGPARPRPPARDAGAVETDPVGQ